MAACGSLQHIHENSFPENPTTLIESLSPWNKIKPVKPFDQSSFIDMFGELHFKGSSRSSASSSFSVPPVSSSSSSSSASSSSSSSSFLEFKRPKDDGLDVNSDNRKSSKYTGCHRQSDSFSSMNSESLQLCTEGLGFESLDDVENLKNDMNEDLENDQQEKVRARLKNSPTENLSGELRRSRTRTREFPPPISCIGQSGKPWVCFKSYRQNGRFVLKEIRMPTQEFLHACREDGRLRLQFVQPNDDIQELEEEDYEEEEEEEEENESIHFDGDVEREVDTRK